MKITIIWRFIVGIDISKQHLDIYLFDRKTGDGAACQVPNTKEGFARLARWLESRKADNGYL